MLDDSLQPAAKSKKASAVAGLVIDNGRRLPTEVIQENILALNAQVDEHVDTGLVHHGWPTHIELAIFRRWMVLQVLLIQHVVNEAG